MLLILQELLTLFKRLFKDIYNKFASRFLILVHFFYSKFTDFAGFVNSNFGVHLCNANVGEKFKHVDNHTIWINPDDNRHILAGCDGGVYETFDLGKNWLFKNTIPQENLTQNLTPQNSDGFMSFTFKNFKTIEANFIAYNNKDSVATNQPVFDNIVEVGVIYQDENRAIVLNSIDFISTEDALISEQTIVENSRGVDIYSFSQPELFSKTFSPLITFKNAKKYCVLDNFFVFSDNSELLQNIIANFTS